MDTKIQSTGVGKLQSLQGETIKKALANCNENLWENMISTTKKLMDQRKKLHIEKMAAMWCQKQRMEKRFQKFLTKITN